MTKTDILPKCICTACFDTVKDFDEFHRHVRAGQEIYTRNLVKRAQHPINANRPYGNCNNKSDVDVKIDLDDAEEIAPTSVVEIIDYIDLVSGLSNVFLFSRENSSANFGRFSFSFYDR